MAVGTSPLKWSVQSWDLERVLEWLIQEGLETHCTLFEENGLTGAALQELTKASFVLYFVRL